MNVRVSDGLRREISRDWFEVSRRVKEAQGLAPPTAPTLAGAVRALSLKVAVDRSNEAVIARGVAALARLGAP